MNGAIGVEVHPNRALKAAFSPSFANRFRSHKIMASIVGDD